MDISKGSRLVRLRRLVTDTQAATSTEYAVMLAMILLVALSAVTTYGQSLRGLFVDIEGTLFAA